MPRPVTFLVVVFATLLTATSASAIPFGQTDFLTSTSTTSGFVDLPPAPVLPADATFTLATPALVGLAGGEGKFLRFNFVLPADFFNLAFSFEASVDNEFAVYLNDTVIAMQTSTDVEAFTPPFPGFSLAADGTVTDTSGGKLEFLLASMQSLFQVGANELTLFGTDLGGVGSIQFANGTITFDTRSSPAPEPSTLLLLGGGLAAVALRCKRRRSRV